MEIEGIILHIGSFLVIAGIYAIINVGLNVHYGHTGLFNIGIAAFFALGAYTAAILVMPPPDPDLYQRYVWGGNLAFTLGSERIGFDLWFPLVLIAAAAVCAGIAYLVGSITIRLRGDYLAITTLGLGEAVRLVFTNEGWLADGTRGLNGIPRVLDNLKFPSWLAFGSDGVVDPHWYDFVFLPLVLIVLVIVYFVSQRLSASPWGRVILAIRENEDTVEMVGKNVFQFKLQAFAYGAALMGIGGALYAFAKHSITPIAFEPFYGTFIIWAMLILGGSGNHRGAILGAFILWAVISSSQFLPGFLADPNLRLAVIGLMIVGVLLFRPAGIIPETRTRT